MRPIVKHPQHLIDSFNQLKECGAIPSDSRDIGKWAAVNTATFAESIAEWKRLFDARDTKRSRRSKVRAAKNDIVILYENDSLRVIVPLNQYAAAYHGKGTRWCTATIDGENTFNAIVSEGACIVYAIGLESKTAMVVDMDDGEVLEHKDSDNREIQYSPSKYIPDWKHLVWKIISDGHILRMFQD